MTAGLDKLLEYQYPNLYHSIKSTHEYIEQHQAEVRTSAVPGFTTSMKTRPLIIAKLEEFIRNKLITIYSSRFLNEMTTFIWNNGKPQAMRGYNDDLIMAMAIACWVKDTALEVNQRDIEYKKAILGGMFMKTTKMKTTIEGMDGHKNSINEEYEKHKKETKDFAWIFKG